MNAQTLAFAPVNTSPHVVLADPGYYRAVDATHTVDVYRTDGGWRITAYVTTSGVIELDTAVSAPRAGYPTTALAAAQAWADTRL